MEVENQLDHLSSTYQIVAEGKSDLEVHPMCTQDPWSSLNIFTFYTLDFLPKLLELHTDAVALENFQCTRFIYSSHTLCSHVCLSRSKPPLGSNQCIESFKMLSHKTVSPHSCSWSVVAKVMNTECKLMQYSHFFQDQEEWEEKDALFLCIV